LINENDDEDGGAPEGDVGGVVVVVVVGTEWRAQASRLSVPYVI